MGLVEVLVHSADGCGLLPAPRHQPSHVIYGHGAFGTRGEDLEVVDAADVGHGAPVAVPVPPSAVEWASHIVMEEFSVAVAGVDDVGVRWVPVDRQAIAWKVCVTVVWRGAAGPHPAEIRTNYLQEAAVCGNEGARSRRTVGVGLDTAGPQIGIGDR